MVLPLTARKLVHNRYMHLKCFKDGVTGLQRRDRLYEFNCRSIRLNVKTVKDAEILQPLLVNPPASVYATPATQLLACFGDKTASIQQLSKWCQPLIHFKLFVAYTSCFIWTVAYFID
jgi:hypothetical protein